MDRSAGETPLILDAWPNVSGRILCNFCFPSADKAGMVR